MYVYIYIYIYIYMYTIQHSLLSQYSAGHCTASLTSHYGVATVSRIDKIIGLFCRIASLLWVSFAKETYNFIDPTCCSHPILYSAEKMVRHAHYTAHAKGRQWWIETETAGQKCKMVAIMGR